MSVRSEHLTPEAAAVQRDLDRSWDGAQRSLNDPVFRAYLEKSIQRLNSAAPTPSLSKDEFLAQTELPTE